MQENGLPNTFVPDHNLLFMMVAATLAYRRGLDALVEMVRTETHTCYPGERGVA